MFLIKGLSKYDFEKIYILTGYKSKSIFDKFHNKYVNFPKQVSKPLDYIEDKVPILKKENINDFILINLVNF